ncbi:hypothetical protein FV219_02520 [Methylobacterium sp. WL122]|nr:hypothetical protein FV219_02520 [Methylobacterium sp. WL122]
MTTNAFRRRLDRIEGSRSTGRITAICNLGGYPESIAAEAVMDWRTWIADGRASQSGHVLTLRAPVLTADEWTAVHEPRDGGFH